mmetsp:Transcript_1777/g.1566  ORF Transcript_1777/g.1566 Transcript_1777/m.1566 type:complete len:93 (+) Transcript_1777:430-708(+)
MSLNDLFVDQSHKISDMLTLQQREKQSKLSKMSKGQYHQFFLKKLEELEEFMRPENHKRWFRGNNSQLTSSLVKSQINMIKNSLGGASLNNI